MFRGITQPRSDILWHKKGLSQSNQPNQLSAMGFYAVKGHPKASTCPGELFPGPPAQGEGAEEGPCGPAGLTFLGSPSWVKGPQRRFGGCLVWLQVDATCPGLILLPQQTGLPELACPLFREALLNARRGCGWQKEPVQPGSACLLPTSLHPWEE